MGRREEDHAAKVEALRRRVRSKGLRARAEDSIADAMEPGDLDAIQHESERAFASLLHTLCIDVDSDPHTEGTAHRLAVMFVREFLAGRYLGPPECTAFPTERTIEPYVVGPIRVQSVCAHHFQPIRGLVYIGVDAPAELLGLSKFHRLVAWLAARPTVQETLTEAIADEITQRTGAQGCLVWMQASHGCMTNRGMRAEQGLMDTLAARGTFCDAADLQRDTLTRMRTLRGSEL